MPGRRAPPRALGGRPAPYMSPTSPRSPPMPYGDPKRGSRAPPGASMITSQYATVNVRARAIHTSPFERRTETDRERERTEGGTDDSAARTATDFARLRPARLELYPSRSGARASFDAREGRTPRAPRNPTHPTGAGCRAKFRRPQIRVKIEILFSCLFRK